MKWLAVLALLMSAGPVMADEPVPTEGGEQTDSAPADKPDTGCHRCVDNPDGGYSDSDYSNPSGAWTTTAGDTTYSPGHSQDWYESTGTWAPAAKRAPEKAASGKGGPAQETEGMGGGNGGGHDR